MNKPLNGTDVRIILYGAPHTKQYSTRSGETVEYSYKYRAGCIYFLDGVDALLDTDRVVLEYKHNKLYFRPVEKKYRGSLALTKSRIQVSANVEKLAQFEGAFPLRFDSEVGWYCINLADRMEDTARVHHKSVRKPNRNRPAIPYKPFVPDDNEQPVVETPTVEEEYKTTGSNTSSDSVKTDLRRQVLYDMLMEFVEQDLLEPAKKIVAKLRAMQ